MAGILKSKSFSNNIEPRAFDKTANTTKISFYSPNDITRTTNASMNKTINTRFQSDPRLTTRANTEKARIFEQIAKKEKFIEQSMRENKYDRRVLDKIQFENNIQSKKGKGEYSSVIVEQKYEPQYEPKIKIWSGPRITNQASEEFKRTRKPAPEEVKPPRRDPIVAGETGKLIKPRDRDFKASVHSQVHTFKRFFLPSEWRAETYGYPGTPNAGQSNIKSLLSHEYISCKGF